MNWRRSSRCSSGSCAEVSITSDAVRVRDSKLDESPTLTFDPRQWQVFVDDLRTGQLARP